jgi:hypothetical protein
MKTITSKLIIRCALAVVAGLIAVTTVQAQWYVDDVHDGDSKFLHIMPDGTLVSAGGNWNVRLRDSSGNWQTIHDLVNDSDAYSGVNFGLAVDASGSIYLGGFVFVNEATGKGNRTSTVSYAAVRKGTYVNGTWIWKYIYKEDDNIHGEIKDVAVDPYGQIYVVLSSTSPAGQLIKRRPNGGESGVWEVVDDYDYNQVAADPAFQGYDVADFADEMTVDPAGNVYVASRNELVTGVIPGKGKKGTPTLQTEWRLVIRRYDAQSGLWETIEEASNEGRDTITPSDLMVTTSGLVLYAAAYYNAPDPSSNLWITRAGTYDVGLGKWKFEEVDRLEGARVVPNAIAESPNGNIYVDGRQNDPDHGFPAAGLVRTIQDVLSLSWDTEVLPTFDPSGIAFQGNSVFIAGRDLDGIDVDVIRKDLP